MGHSYSRKAVMLLTIMCPTSFAHVNSKEIGLYDDASDGALLLGIGGIFVYFQSQGSSPLNRDFLNNRHRYFEHHSV